MSGYAERRMRLILFLVLPLLASASPIISVAAQQTSNFYYVNIIKVDYPIEVPINSTFRITVVVNYSLPELSGYSISTSKWLIAARLYNSTGGAPTLSADTFVAASNVDQVSNRGTDILSISASAPSFRTALKFTIYAMYQSVSSFTASSPLFAPKDSGWTYSRGPNSNVGFSVKVSETVSLRLTASDLQIPVVIDGAQGYDTDNAGHLTVNLTVLQWHLIGIPATINLGQGTRVVFVSWQDGTNSTGLPIYMKSDVSLNATYKIQYLLRVNDGQGSGWYDKASIANVNAVSEKRARGIMGLIGFKDVFRGWTGDIQSQNTTVTIIMDKPHQLTAQYQTEMPVIHTFIDFVLHLDKYLNRLIQTFGFWTYGILFVVIFCEIGLVVTPFFPGDSLLFVSGTLANNGALNVELLFLFLSLAAIMGETMNYSIGHFVGPRVFTKRNSRIFNEAYLERAQEFYQKHGGKTIIIARFVPVVRTFAPFVAGIGKMNYAKFTLYNVLGGIGWVAIFIFSGYFFGSFPIVRDNLAFVIIGIIVFSLLPAVFEYSRRRIEKKTRR